MGGGQRGGRPLGRLVLPTLATLALLASQTTEARAQAETYGEVPSDPPPTEATPQPAGDPPRPSAAHPFHLQMAALGDYRRVQDLDVLGGGLEMSLVCGCDKGGQFNFRAMSGRTMGGLSVVEGAVGGSAEFVVVGGLVLGVGGGVVLFGVQRATNGSELISVGPEVFGRVGYRFAKGAAPFVALDVGGQWQAGPTFVGGPTLAVGYRF